MTHRKSGGAKHNPEDAASGPTADAPREGFSIVASAEKGEAGMVVAQSPGSTEFDGMPRRAIATAFLNEAGQMYGIATTERAIKGGAP